MVTMPRPPTRLFASPTGRKYHVAAGCGGKRTRPVSVDVAAGRGLRPCRTCQPPPLNMIRRITTTTRTPRTTRTR